MRAFEALGVSENNPAAWRGWQLVGVLLIAYVVAYLDRQIIVLLVPELKADLSLGDTQVGLLQGLAFALFFALAGLPIGSLVDRFNRRRILILGVLTWSAATFVCGLSRNFNELFLARLLVGAGEACLAPAGFSMLADLFPPERRGRAIGVTLAGSAIGVGCSSLLGGLLINALNRHPGLTLPLLGPVATWQAVFFIAALPGFLVCILLLSIKEPERTQHSSTELRGGSLFSYFKGRATTLSLVLLIFSLNQLIGYGVIVWGPLVFMRVHGMSAGDVGIMVGWLVITVNALPHPLGGLFADWYSGRRPLDGRVRLALVTIPVALGFVLLFLAPPSIALALTAYLGASFFSGVLNGASYSAMHELVPTELRGRIVAAYTLVAVMLALGVGPPLIGMMTDYVFKDDRMVAYSIVSVTGAAGLVAFLCTMLALPLVRKTRQEILSTAGHAH